LKNFTFRVHFTFLVNTHTILFNLAQFTLIIDNTEQIILEKRTLHLHLQHYTPKNRICINFPHRMIFLWYNELPHFCPKQTIINSVASTMHTGNTLTLLIVSMKLYHRKNINISMIRTGRYLKNTTQISKQCSACTCCGGHYEN